MIRYIAGPPCSGKTTYAKTNAATCDVILDLDDLAATLGYPYDHIDWAIPTELDHPARRLALTARRSILKHHSATPVTLWVIDSNRTDHHDSVVLDPGPDECHRRANEGQRSEQTHDEIDAWYQRHGANR